MSLFGKIKSAVMGNPVTREYEVGKHVASAGPGLLWKVYTGVKKSTRQEVSVFIFHKQTPEFEKMPKKQREAICEMLKKGPTHLVKLRHPRLLTIHHSVEESSDCLAFATEPIFASLANVLGHYDNLPTPLPLVIKEHQLRPIEIQYGLLEVSEALLFLHADVKMMHGNLTPEAIVINAQGAWKVMGFNFCCYSHYQSEAQMTFQFREWDKRRPLHTNPSLDYLAPEYILSKSCNELSDIYSYGMLCYAAYNHGKPLYESQNNMLSFKQNIEQISRITETTLGQLPVVFKPLIRSTLAVEPSVRPDALQLTKHPFFEELAVSTLRYLDMLYERGDMEKSQFFKKNLARVMNKLPKRVVHQRVLPALAGEFRNKKMIPFILPLILLVAEDCTMHEYATLIFPILIPALQVQDPIQVPTIFLQKMDLLLKKTSVDNVKRHILPMIITSLEADNTQLQELCVSILPSFANMVDYSSMKHSIVPRMTALCIETRATSLRIKCLVSVGQMLDILDKHIVLDHVLPILEQMPSREPGVLMGMLGIYHQTLVNKKLGMDKMMLATRVLPFLIPIAMEPTLNLKQFNQFMLVIKDMLQRVEKEQQDHLDQLSKMEEQTKSTVEFAREVAETKVMDDALDRLDEMFGSSGSHDTFSPPRLGSALPPQANATASVSESASGTGDADLFAGFMASEPVTMATSSSLLTPTPAATVTASSQVSRSEPLKPVPVQSYTQTQNSSSPAASYTPPPPRPMTTPSMPPPLQPQTAATLNDSSSSGKIFQTSNPNRSASSSGPMSWSSNLLTPSTSTGFTAGLTGSQNLNATQTGSIPLPTRLTGSHSLSATQTGSTGLTAGLTGSQNLTATQTGSTTSGLFSGMQLGSSLAPANHTTAPMAPMAGSLVQQHESPTSTLQNQQLLSTTSSWQPNLTNQRAQTSLAPPLIPTQPQQQDSINTGMGWSSTIQGQNPHSTNIQGSFETHGQSTQSLMGWSSNIAARPQPQAASSATGWSQNIGTTQPQGSGTGMGMGWTGGMQGIGGSQPTAASVMIGVGQPLVPQNTSSVARQPSPQQHPAPGANPFADLNFLS